MKAEIDKSQEKQKRNRQTSMKQALKPSNPASNIPQLLTSGPTSTGITATSGPIPQQSNPTHPKNDLNQTENKQNKEELKLDLEELKQTHHEEEKVGDRKHTDDSRVKESDKVSFKVETEERDLEVYKNPESPRPAPPVFDENLEAEAIYNKQERKAKEKEAMELAQKAAHEQKLKVEQELGEKKNELNQLEDKYENIAAKYMNKK